MSQAFKNIQASALEPKYLPKVDAFTSQ